MKWIKNIFKSKPKEYFYYKKVVDKYYGLCGTERKYTKRLQETCHYSTLFDAINIKKMTDKGWVIINKDEFLTNKG